MKFDLNEAVAVLERTPVTLKTLLNDLPATWTANNEGENTWSPYDIIGHLIHGERTDWIPRAEIILSQSGKPFEPFDRFAQFENSKGKDLNQLLEEFANLRSENLKKLKALNITDEQLSLKGIHPALGEATLGQLLATWVVHDLNHINQITRVMAKQYKPEVGPWVEYLGVLNK